MRDQYAADVSDVLKFAFLRALPGAEDAWNRLVRGAQRRRACGRTAHLEWRDEPAWRKLDAELHAGLAALPERSIATLEATAIWPKGVLFHREAVPPRIERGARGARKRAALDGADIIFLDPDNGLSGETEKHANVSEIRLLRKSGHTIAFTTFRGRNMPHDVLLRHLHDRLSVQTNAESVVTLRTNVFVPRVDGSRAFVQRQRWFTMVDPDADLTDRARAFATALASVPRVGARLDGTT